MADLKGGTTGQILSKATNADMDFTWIANDQGDITNIAVTSPITGGGSSGSVTIGVNAASTSASGVVQLSDSTSTTSSVLASTPTATKSAYDLADAAIAKSTLTTAGDIVYRNATVPVRLGIGTAGQVLKVNSGATAPEWGAASSGFPVSTVFTPTVTSQSGSITTYTATGSYQTSGKLVVANFKITLTNVGTASGTLYATLPVQAVTLTNGTWNGTCVENNTTGKTGIMSVTTGSTIVTSRDYNFSTWFVNGYTIYGSVAYEVA
jgi:hypothetical protein